MFFSSSTCQQSQAPPSVELPLPATTRTSTTTTTSPIDDFFGSTCSSRHVCRSSVSSNKEDDLPSYSDVEAHDPPSYSQRGHKEPVTLAMYLFKFGFYKTPAERAAIIQQIRNTEVKWAKRCLAALGILCALGLAAGLAIGYALKQ
ncbi:hypothetical protein EYR38_002330 [Pleurotus pulmonarius]|nr:hypothetical protein EYR38_002330 [Pleurotus pulmonarius]